jgi:hypothetical protein
MIQRIQTLWFLFTALFSGLLIPGSFLHFSGEKGADYLIGFSGLLKSETGSQDLLTRLYPMAIIVLIIIALSLISIFLFKKRTIQKILAIVIILLSCILIIMLAYSSYKLISDFNVEVVPTVKMVVPFLIPLTAYMAYRGIIKDDKLVRSYDRLR